LKKQIQQLFFGKLAKASSWLFTGGIVGGVLGYLFQIIMGRMLSVAEYGVLAALMASMMLIGAPLSTLTMVVSRKVSSYRSDEYANHRAYLFYMVNKKIVLLVMVFVITVLFYLEPIQHFLSIEKNVHLYLLISIIIIAFPQAVNIAYLQGLQYFKWLSVSGVLTTLLKIVIAVVLIYAGFGVSGALGGVLISSLIVLILIYVVLRPSIGRRGSEPNSKICLSYSAAVPVLIANFAFAVMTQMDMVLVKHFFSAHDAGLYAAASVLGKAVMYLPGGIALALFPMVAENHADGKSSAHLLIQAFSLTAILCLIGALLYYYFSDLIITLLYGEDFKPAAEILKYFGFAMLPMALIMVAEYFLIAMGRVLFAYIFMVVAPLQLIAIYYYHDTLLNMVVIMAITGITLTLLGYGLLWRTYKNGKTTT
jgi:O-antigen/teichoic acid export membrane protein